MTAARAPSNPSNRWGGYRGEIHAPNGPLPDRAPERILVPDVTDPARDCRRERPPSCSTTIPKGQEGDNVTNLLRRLWTEDEGQDIAEYAVMLAVILVIVVGTIRLIGGNANNVFSSVSSSIGS
jgi:Flp pilus assembly pilin Flp